MTVQVGLCRTWSETPKTGFLASRLNCIYIYTCSFLIAGERLSELEVEDLLKHIDLTEDLEGNVKYEGEQFHNLFQSIN